MNLGSEPDTKVRQTTLCKGEFGMGGLLRSVRTVRTASPTIPDQRFTSALCSWRLMLNETTRVEGDTCQV